MSEPNGQRGATTPSSSSTPTFWEGTVPRDTDNPASQGDDNGQPTDGSSAPQATRASIHARRGQKTGGINTAGQGRNQRGPGRGSASLSGNTSRATSQAPSVGRGGRETLSVLGKRGPDALMDAFKEYKSKRQATGPTVTPRNELSVQTNVSNQPTNMVLRNSSENPTNFRNPIHTHEGGVKAVINFETQEGLQALFAFAQATEQRIGPGAVHISMKPFRDEEATIEDEAFDPSSYIPPRRPDALNSRVEERPGDNAANLHSVVPASGIDDSEDELRSAYMNPDHPASVRRRKARKIVDEDAKKLRVAASALGGDESDDVLFSDFKDRAKSLNGKEPLGSGAGVQDTTRKFNISAVAMPLDDSLKLEDFDRRRVQHRPPFS